MRMLRIPDSSNLLAVGYDPRGQTLRVQFKSGTVYEYANVNTSEFAALVSAESIGSHFASAIRTNAAHPSRRIVDPVPPTPGAPTPDSSC